MPLPDNPKVNALADELVSTMREVFKTPKTYRPVHAKGQLCSGTFKPSPTAKELSKAPIFTSPSTRLVCRYSTDTGLPNFHDNEDNASRGFAVRFLLSDDNHKHFDIITNNAFGFITGTGEGFLEQFKAMKAGKMDEWVNANPHAKYFQENQAPLHAVSFATEQWYATHAYKFVNANNQERYFRWRFVPWQGVRKYSKEEAKSKGDNFQFDDLVMRLTSGKPIKYRLLAQLAEEGDITDDSTKTWPESNEFAEMGEITIDSLWRDDEKDGKEPHAAEDPHGRDQRRIIYDPVPRYMEGVEVSGDPLFEVRTSVYLKSGMIRREADGLVE